jgi:serine/threonine-protein kinase RsbW
MVDLRALGPEFFPDRVVIPSDSGAAKQVITDIITRLRQLDYDDAEIYGINAALEEALVNAIKHGNTCDNTKKVHIAYRADPDGFYVRIHDEGKGFDPAAVPDPRHCVFKDLPNGRGLLMMRNYMCAVQYLDKGNVVVMAKLRKA